MRPINQTIITSDTGDCQRAAVASLFELQLEQVPHFRLFADDIWHTVYFYFIYSLGWEYCGFGKPHTHELKGEHFVHGHSIAMVKSKTFGNGVYHSVVIDLDGVIVHDPNPNKLWQGKNVLNCGDLIGWDLFNKR